MSFPLFFSLKYNMYNIRQVFICPVVIRDYLNNSRCDGFRNVIFSVFFFFNKTINQVEMDCIGNFLNIVILMESTYSMSIISIYSQTRN